MLRPYQEKAVSDIEAAYTEGHKSVCFTLPCGGGKTQVFSHISGLTAAVGRRTVILVHRDSLLTQASNKLKECGIKHSIIAPGHRFYGDNVSVASINTLVRRLDNRYDFDFIVVDECHHSTAPSYRKIFAGWPDAHILGVTASPCRTNGEGLDSVFQHLVHGPNIAELIADGYLVEPITYGPVHKLDLSQVGVKMGDYNTAQLFDQLDKPKITGDAVQQYSKICPHAPAMVFCVNIQHAMDVSETFKEAGYKSACVSGNMHLSVIRERIAGLTNGSIEVLTACDLVSEGTDLPAVVCAINLRPTKSLGLHIQQGGRALRPIYAPGFDLTTRAGRLAAIAASVKPHAIILDHSSNFIRFGLIDEPQEWTLQGRSKRARKGDDEKNVKVKQCPQCFFAHRPGPSCPHCGYVYVVMTEGPEVVDGQLERIDKTALRRSREAEVRKCRTYADLKGMGKRMGYHPAWAYRKWIERGGDPALT